mgnify:CR=1 FL=1
MGYKYNITYKENDESKVINFNSKVNMIDYLNKNKKKLQSFNHVILNFKQIQLALNSTIWRK